MRTQWKGERGQEERFFFFLKSTKSRVWKGGKESVRGVEFAEKRRADIENIGSVITAEFKVRVMLVLSKLIKPQELNIHSYFPVSVYVREKENKTERECACWRKWWHLAVLLYFVLKMFQASTLTIWTQMTYIVSSFLQVNSVLNKKRWEIFSHFNSSWYPVSNLLR